MPSAFCFQRKAAPSLRRPPQPLKFCALRDSRMHLQPRNQPCCCVRAERPISAEPTAQRCGSHPASHPPESEQSSLDTINFLLQSQNSSLLSQQVPGLQHSCSLQRWRQQTFICSGWAGAASATKQTERETGMTQDVPGRRVFGYSLLRSQPAKPSTPVLPRAATRASEGRTSGTSFLASPTRQCCQERNCRQGGTPAQNKRVSHQLHATASLLLERMPKGKKN